MFISVLILGMYCMPVAAELSDSTPWEFYIDNNIYASSRFYLNAHEIHCNFVKVNVQNSDNATIRFVVDYRMGPSTTVTILRDDIQGLNGDLYHHPVIYTWGSAGLYDVDLAVWDFDKEEFTVKRHLIERGSTHIGIGKSQKAPDLPWEKFGEVFI
jgi:hypothetical protein